jgi:hypothetical protein
MARRAPQLHGNGISKPKSKYIQLVLFQRFRLSPSPVPVAIPPLDHASPLHHPAGRGAGGGGRGGDNGFTVQKVHICVRVGKSSGAPGPAGPAPHPMLKALTPLQIWRSPWAGYREISRYLCTGSYLIISHADGRRRIQPAPLRAKGLSVCLIPIFSATNERCTCIYLSKALAARPVISVSGQTSRREDGFLEVGQYLGN